MRQNWIEEAMQDIKKEVIASFKKIFGSKHCESMLKIIHYAANEEFEPAKRIINDFDLSEIELAAIGDEYETFERLFREKLDRESENESICTWEEKEEYYERYGS
jgi:arsenate reductase-like glutaredoxin family protein